jgi:hypothetical protein
MTTDAADYDPATHDDAIAAFAYDIGTAWLEGEPVPTADEVLHDYEATFRVYLPDRDGPALARLRRLARTRLSAGRADVA